ncbi:cyclin-like protein [Scheffersomyces xylosifermentans]|uniref:cyclin-like protein n=1 Tax=Scheffersomyces xylosifermentans TaxID=1304137 RepID=UPI00315CA953
MSQDNRTSNARNGSSGKAPSSGDRNTWLFSEEAFLAQSPSRQQKMSVSQELKVRESIHDFVIRLGSSLKLDGRTILAATIYINRYYMRMPITSSKYYVASAAIAISCKLNDTYRQPDKIALQACNIKNPNPSRPIDEQSDMFWRWRDQLLFREELILKTLNFDLNVDLPYSIRDELFNSHEYESGLFAERKADILKNTVALIEVLSSLPILVAFDMYTVFGTALLVITMEAAQKFNEKTFQLPKYYLRYHLQEDAKACYECYQYIMRLLKYAERDPSAQSNKAAIRRLHSLEEADFRRLANEDEVEEKSEKPSDETSPTEASTEEVKTSEVQEPDVTNEVHKPDIAKLKKEPPQGPAAHKPNPIVSRQLNY